MVVQAFLLMNEMLSTLVIIIRMLFCYYLSDIFVLSYNKGVLSFLKISNNLSIFTIKNILHGFETKSLFFISEWQKNAQLG